MGVDGEGKPRPPQVVVPQVHQLRVMARRSARVAPAWKSAVEVGKEGRPEVELMVVSVAKVDGNKRISD